MRLYNSTFADFTEIYFANIVLGIIVSSCLGSIAAMLILMTGGGMVQMIQLFAVVIVAMWYNASVLTVMKPKFVFNSLILSTLVSLFFIIFHLLLILF